MTIEQRLADYLYANIGKLFRYGVCDCVTFVADWVFVVRGVDLAKGFKENAKEYDAEHEIARVGGWVRVVSEAFAVANIPRVLPKKMQVGDIALVKLSCGELGMGIKTADGCALKTINGFVIAQPKVIRAWSIRHGD